MRLVDIGDAGPCVQRTRKQCSGEGFMEEGMEKASWRRLHGGGDGKGFMEEGSPRHAIGMGRQTRPFQAREPPDRESTEWGVFVLCLGK